MEGLIPYVYRAIVQYRTSNAGQRIYGALAASPPGDSGRFSWDSAYIRLPGDSGRFASDFHTIYRRPQSPPSSNHTTNGPNEDFLGTHSASRPPLAPPAATATTHHSKTN
ncbi:hypothetical protein SUGI_0495810 [Cryptomeria japonica]|uniref:uncharacterized protein LOC131875904 n=1 Tax=Cryptomeria japonica TaxID=3369 RepID=UPI002408E890|nr:uncharacterized protein LOC131875904 [Cryptomeria japonica]GLJ25869.1 hypothetical protein SUGI_0495810 [Cryptomeria japonica]